MTEIAIGSSLEHHFYDSIHCSSAKNTIKRTSADANADSFQERETELNESNTASSYNEDFDSKQSCAQVSKILDSFDQFYHNVVEDLQNGDEEFRKSMKIFLARYSKFSPNQRNSALQSFGTVFVGKSRGKNKVQPTAVSRRVSQIGSRQRQSNNKIKALPKRRITLKRKHKLADVVDLNVASAKKAGTSMKIKTKYPKKKAKKQENNDIHEKYISHKNITP